MNNAPWYIASSANAYDTKHATKSAVVSKAIDGAIFFNPIIKKDGATALNSVNAYVNLNNQMGSNTKIDNFAPGSLGTAMWYQRPDGLYHD